MSIKVFGITGTNGKTTVSYILRNILKTTNKECGLIGTISHEIAGCDYPAINTTPGAELLKSFFSKMEEAETEYCVMEVSSHGLVQGRVDGIDIDFAGFTNLTQDHLDYHETMESYFQAKKKLFRISKRANVINIDDPAGRKLYGELEEIEDTRGKILCGYSILNETCEFYGDVCYSGMKGTTVRFFEKGANLGSFQVQAPGLFSVYNGLLAAGLARAAGISFDQIRKGVEMTGNVPGRFEIYHGSRGEMVIVDFAHTPDALLNLLQTARQLLSNGGKLICLFGCGGNRDRGKRKKMGMVAGTHSDYVVITSDNPRGEDPEDIAAEIEEGVYETGCDYRIVIDRYQGIKMAVSICRKGDILVVAGKGHEAYQIVGNDKRPFDDRQIVKEELEK